MQLTSLKEDNVPEEKLIGVVNLNVKLRLCPQIMIFNRRVFIPGPNTFIVQLWRRFFFHWYKFVRLWRKIRLCLWLKMGNYTHQNFLDVTELLPYLLSIIILHRKPYLGQIRLFCKFFSWPISWPKSKFVLWFKWSTTEACGWITQSKYYQTIVSNANPWNPYKNAIP